MSLFRKLCYKTKLILYYLVLIFLPLLLCLILLYSSLVRPVFEKTLNSIHERVEQEINEVDNRVKKLHNISYLLSTNTIINNFIVPDQYSDLDLIQSMNTGVFPLLSWLEATNPEIYGYHFFTSNGAIPESEFLHQYGDYESEEWMREAEEAIYEKGYYLEPYHISRQYRYNRSSDPVPVYSFFYPLLTSKSYMEICVRPSVFFQDINATAVMNSGFMACISQDGALVSTDIPENMSDAVTKFYAQENFDDTLSEQQFQTTLNDKDYFIYTRFVPSLNCRLLCIIPNEEITGPFIQAQQLFAIIIIVTIAAIIFLSYLVSSLLIRRINTMVEAVREIQKGNFNICISTNGNDEIDHLANSINYMSVQINELINNVYKTKMLQKDTELSALQAQINPHFLFNILDTFKMIAIIHNLDDFSDSIAALGNLMRYNIAPSGRRTTLANELKIIKDYVNIQNLLLNNRVTLSLAVPQEFLLYEIPTFILQPIVENAFVHGFENKLDELLISLSVCQDNNNIVFKLEDNGIGISEDEKTALVRSLKEVIENPDTLPVGKSIGMNNVNLRLYLLYRERYSLSISSSDLGGACICVSLPLDMRCAIRQEPEL